MALKLFQGVLKFQNTGYTLIRPSTRVAKQCCCFNFHTDHNVETASVLNKFSESDIPLEQPNICLAKTTENNPAKHGMSHIGLYYTIDRLDFYRLAEDVQYRHIKRQTRAFNEACIMIRKPAVEIIHVLNNLKDNHSLVKFVLYGHKGCGKTITKLHIMHYCKDWILLHTPWPLLWIEYFHEVAASSYKPGRIDLPIEAKEFLQCFLKLNKDKFGDNKTHFRYEWTKREVTEIGTPIEELIEFGITRAKFADDVLGALLKEIKYLASQNKIKVLIALEGINAFFKDSHMNVRKMEYKGALETSGLNKYTSLPAKDLSIVANFMKFLQPDLLNSVLVSTVDYNLNPKDDRSNTKPRHILGKEGFEFLDPFIPIEVDNYTDKEAYSCLEYFIDRKWIMHPQGKTDEGKKQLLFLSNKHPKSLYRVCAAY